MEEEFHEVNEADKTHGVNELERYDRQLRVWGADGQQKINSAKIAIIGSGNLAKYFALPLKALGVGELRIIGGEYSGEHEMFLDIPLENKFRAKGYEHALRKINPQGNVIAVPLDLETRLGQHFLRGVNVIIDSTNDPRSKALALEYASSHNIPLLSAACAGGYAKMQLFLPGTEPGMEYIMPFFEGLEQNELIALLWGGVGSEEVKKIILEDDNLLSQPIYYKVGGADRFSYLKDGEEMRSFGMDSLHKLLSLDVGAGALGNIYAIGAALLGLSTHYIDPDKIESTNLNRQVLFRDSVGMYKAEVIAQKHKAMNPNVDVGYFINKLDIADGRFTLDELHPEGYDLGFDLVDNLYARALFSAYAVQHEMPLVTAASSPTACDVAIYAPGKTSCFNHVFSSYYDKGIKEEIIRRQSCIAQPNPSVIITNQIGAALALLEACSIFDPDKFGEPFNGSLQYSTIRKERLGINPISHVCDCYKTKEIPELEIKIN